MSARPSGASAEILEAADLRFGQVGIASVRVRSSDPAALRAAIEVRVREAPALFERAPVVVDLSFLTPQPGEDAARALLDAVRGAGMLPVGLAYGDEATDELARRLGLPLIAKFRAQYERAERTASNDEPMPHATAAAQPVAAASADPVTALQHHQQVRTGQQVYAQGCDLVVVGTVANGAEVLADGNIHVYGALRGRAFAGALGDKAARIFCGEFRAEIVSIAGHYRVFEELPKEYAGKAVQIRLEQERLQIARL
ncbi:MAG: septum site-determining protein MinC [Xanthomonadaceae bacterium]|nr:septum site-determining protein MinC [Xanthomonadaceae bacterium]MBU6477128.1 septum site-determining protein MinC [Xanthomonadaceae bacterium]